jgi:hypothetical protein
MSIYLNKSFKGKLRKTREVIRQLQDEQDKTFNSLRKELNVNDNGPEFDALWDYIFNDWDIGITFTDKKDSGFVPLSPKIKKTNGGQLCDMQKGPCACGAWH